MMMMPLHVIPLHMIIGDVWDDASFISEVCMEYGMKNTREILVYFKQYTFPVFLECGMKNTFWILVYSEKYTFQILLQSQQMSSSYQPALSALLLPALNFS